jgi:hypothetical protein
MAPPWTQTLGGPALEFQQAVQPSSTLDRVPPPQTDPTETEEGRTRKILAGGQVEMAPTRTLTGIQDAIRQLGLPAPVDERSGLVR